MEIEPYLGARSASRVGVNGTGGSGFGTILSRWFGALVNVTFGGRLGQQTGRELNSIRRAIFVNHFGALVGAGPREG